MNDTPVHKRAIDLKFAPTVALLSGGLAAVVMVVVTFHGWRSGWILLSVYFCVGLATLASAVRYPIMRRYPFPAMSASFLTVSVVAAALHLFESSGR